MTKVYGVEEFPIGEPTITPIEFKEEKTVTWDEYISAELIATLNAEKISRYGAPADARVINRLVTLPASFDRYVELQVRSHLMQVQPKILSSTYNHKINPFTKSWDSFKGIGISIKNGADTRTDNALRSPYDFGNFLTMGTLDGVYSSYMDRAAKLGNSPYDFFDFLSNGILGAVNGGINPEEPFSADHWLNSIAVVGMVFGGERVTPTRSSVIPVSPSNIIPKGTGKVIAENPLPNVSNATIDPKKLTDYALNPNHPVGGDKAKVFESALGYNKSNADDLLKQVKEKLPQSEAVDKGVDQWGQKYQVDMSITGPNGNTVNVRTGWIKDNGSDTPRLTSIYVKE